LLLFEGPKSSPKVLRRNKLVRQLPDSNRISPVNKHTLMSIILGTHFYDEP